MMGWRLIQILLLLGLLGGCGYDVGNSAQPGPGPEPENRAPVWADGLVTLEVCQDKPFMIDLEKYVSDPDGDSLSFSTEGLPPWATISNEGNFFGASIGVQIHVFYELTITASDQEFDVPKAIQVKIIHLVPNQSQPLF